MHQLLDVEQCGEWLVDLVQLRYADACRSWILHLHSADHHCWQYRSQCRRLLSVDSVEWRGGQRLVRSGGARLARRIDEWLYADVRQWIRLPEHAGTRHHRHQLAMVCSTRRTGTTPGHCVV